MWRWPPLVTGDRGDCHHRPDDLVMTAGRQAVGAGDIVRAAPDGQTPRTGGGVPVIWPVGRDRQTVIMEQPPPPIASFG